MAFLRTVVRSAVLVGLCSAWLQAQRTHARVIVAPQGRPRIAEIAPPPPPSPPRVTTYSPTVFATEPLVVLPDGRVVLDLGTGYQQVTSICVYAYGYACLSYGYPITSFTTIYYAPVYVVPSYNAVVYPTPVYPTAGYHWGCAPGWYPPCFEPFSRSVRSSTIPVSGAMQAAPRRPALGSVLTSVRGARR